jgi:hypothetical protein
VGYVRGVLPDFANCHNVIATPVLYPFPRFRKKFCRRKLLGRRNNIYRLSGWYFTDWYYFYKGSGE